MNLLMAVLEKRVDAKLKNPDVALYSSDKKVEVAPVIKEGVTVVATVYDGNRLKGLDVKKADGENETVLEQLRADSLKLCKAHKLYA